MAKSITDRTVKSQKPKAKPYEIMEKDGFGLRVLPGGSKSFILMKRYPGSKNPARRLLGHYPATTLAEAHEKARQWRGLIELGIVEEKRVREAAIAAEKAKRAATFSRRLRRLLPPEAGKASERACDRK